MVIANEDDAKSDVQRIFIGTFLSTHQQAAVGKLRQHTEKLCQHWHRKVRCVQVEKLHLTWLFLGDVSSNKVSEIHERLSGALSDITAFKIQYDRLAIWPTPKKARQAVFLPNVPQDAAIRTDKVVRAALSEFAVDEKAFNPHVTVMRFAPSRDKQRLDVPEWLDMSDILPIVQEIDRICVIRSHLGKGDFYEAVHTIPLRPFA